MITKDIIGECGTDSQMTKKHVLITDATSGIGLETAGALAWAGAKVYLMGRDINTETEEKSWDIRSSYQQSKLANVLYGHALAFQYKDKINNHHLVFSKYFARKFCGFHCDRCSR